jgi:hypothetical protein
MDLDTFCNIINRVTDLYEEVIEYEQRKVGWNKTILYG